MSALSGQGLQDCGVPASCLKSPSKLRCWRQEIGLEGVYATRFLRGIPFATLNRWHHELMFCFQICQSDGLGYSVDLYNLPVPTKSNKAPAVLICSQRSSMDSYIGTQSSLAVG